MGIKFQAFGFEELKRKYLEELEDRKEILQEELTTQGEELSGHARMNAGYTPHTGNLQSSIGYRLYYNGNKVQDGGFEQVGGPEGDGSEGVEAAHKALDKYEDENDIPDTGYCLVIVTGMYYGRYVEAKGYNVLHLTYDEMIERFQQIRKDFFGL